MKNQANDIEIGYISRAHGILGEVFVRLYGDTIEWEKQPETMALLTKTKECMAYSVKNLKFHKNGLIVRFAECPDRNRAEELVGTKIFLPRDFFVSAIGEAPYFMELIGFEVRDGAKTLGKVLNFVTGGKQNLMEIGTGRSSYLAPFVAELIESVDYQQKVIVMNLPEGLEDL